MSCVYLDYNATAPVEEEVQKSIIYALQVAWGNPTSNHDGGTEARRIIDEARISVANMIGASSPEIVFTSGGTESNNMIIHSLVRHFKKTRSSFASLSNCRIPHFITSNIEHNSIMLTLKDLYEDERIDLTIVPVSKATGSVSSEEIVSAIRPETCLITVMLANNETGIIQPVETIGTLLKDVNQQRKKDSLPEVLFHTDAAQALGKVAVNVDVLKVDYLTIAGHKFYGPRTGALYFRDSKPLYPLLFGAGQEGGLRPGLYSSNCTMFPPLDTLASLGCMTESRDGFSGLSQLPRPGLCCCVTPNTCMIAGVGTAAKLVVKNLDMYHRLMKDSRDYLEEKLKEVFGPLVSFNHRKGTQALPNTCSVSFAGMKGPEILAKAKYVLASTGAACHHTATPSRVLLNSGVTEDNARGTLRLSTGRKTARADVDAAVRLLQDAVSAILKEHSSG
ncbi:selenocysteine lyase-like isoform X2 [Dermacentor albipictus]|uniref:selenocysteine lyase-like isoform X2 n=1 Tax=Dermacentor albipictus TaxID=60249 RepID=UPI0031FD3A6A